MTDHQQPQPATEAPRLSAGPASTCWSCTGLIGSGYGYRLVFHLLFGDTPSVPYLTTDLCWPCMATVNRVFGEPGKAALRTEPAPEETPR